MSRPFDESRRPASFAYQQRLSLDRLSRRQALTDAHRRAALRPVGLLLALLLNGCGETTSEPSALYSLSGTVTVASVEALEAVVVKAFRPSLGSGTPKYSTLTDIDGRYSFHDLENGRYTVAISDYPYTVYFREAEVEVRISKADAEVHFEGTQLLELTNGSHALRRPFLDHPYADTLEASGGEGPYTWAIPAGELPPGLGLDVATGEINGTASALGTVDVTLQVASADGQADSRRFWFTTVLHPSAFCTNHPDSAIATFEDPDLEAAVKAELLLGSQEEITCGSLDGADVIVASPGELQSLLGVQNLPGLVEVWADDNAIVDIGPLEPLTKLTTLHLDDNAIGEVTSLEGLTALERVHLDGNNVSDVEAMAGLTSLRVLHLSSNAVVDVAPLGALTSLTSLDLAGNDITEVTALRSLTELRQLNLAENSITNVHFLEDLTHLVQLSLSTNPDLVDIQALLENRGLGEGDEVSLDGTAVSCEDVAALRANGVTVTSSCPN